MDSLYRAKIIGRLARIALGIFLAARGGVMFADFGTNARLASVAVAVGLLVLYGLVHVGVSKYAATLNPWIGAFLAQTPAAAVAVVGGASGLVGVMAYIGVSLLVAGWRADAGCEAMSIPGVLFGRRTHLVCILFSPLDWLEEKASVSLRPAAGEER